MNLPPLDLTQMAMAMDLVSCWDIEQIEAEESHGCWGTCIDRPELHYSKFMMGDVGFYHAASIKSGSISLFVTEQPEPLHELEIPVSFSTTLQ